MELHPTGPGHKAAVSSQGTLGQLSLGPPIPGLKLTHLSYSEAGKIFQGGITSWGCTHWRGGTALHSGNFRLGELGMQLREGTQGLEGEDPRGPSQEGNQERDGDNGVEGAEGQC